MFWPFNRRRKRIQQARTEYRRAASDLRDASRKWSVLGRRRRAIKRATKRYERAQDRLRALGVIEESGIYPRNWSSLRRNVLARDRHRCTQCGRKRSRKTELQVHHVLPLSRGGRNALDNLVTLCSDCHRAAHRRR